MRQLAVWLLLMSVPVFGQDLKKYVGTWEATFQGKPFFTLKLLNQGDKLSGTVVNDKHQSRPGR